MDAGTFGESMIGDTEVDNAMNNTKYDEIVESKFGANSKQAALQNEETDDYDEIVHDIGKITQSQYEAFSNLVPRHTEKQLPSYVTYNSEKTYTFVYYDLETTCRDTQSAEICQLSAITNSGVEFMRYILPEGDVGYEAWSVNKLTVEEKEGIRRLCKNDEPVESISIEVAIDLLISFLRDVNKRASSSIIVLIGHNSANFDVPILLRSGGTFLVEKLQEMNIHFGDSMPLLKSLVKEKHPLLQPSLDGKNCSLMQTNVFERLFGQEYKAHDALEDVIALRRILSSPELGVDAEKIVNASQILPVHDVKLELDYRDHKYYLKTSFTRKLYYPWGCGSPISKGTTDKIAATGLSYSDLTTLYRLFGKVGVVGILTMPLPSSGKPRVTSNKRVLNSIITHFQSCDKENNNTYK